MSDMQLDGVEADAHSALGGLDKRGAHARHFFFGHGAGQMPARTERNGRGRNGRPGILAGRQRLAAFPGPLRGRLAAGMGKLNSELGAADAVAMRHQPLERGLAGVGIKPQAAMGDAAVRARHGLIRRPASRRRNSPACRDGSCAKSLATPSLALYWHIGETTMRLARLRSASRNGENRALVMTITWGGGDDCGSKRGAIGRAYTRSNARAPYNDRKRENRIKIICLLASLCGRPRSVGQRPLQAADWFSSTLAIMASGS